MAYSASPLASAAASVAAAVVSASVLAVSEEQAARPRAITVLNATATILFFITILSFYIDYIFRFTGENFFSPQNG